MKEEDIKDMGLNPSVHMPRGVPCSDEEAEAILSAEKMTVELVVPQTPSILDLAIAFRSRADKEALDAECAASQAAFDAELSIANAQRIADAARAKAARLRNRVDEIDAQIQALKT